MSEVGLLLPNAPITECNAHLNLDLFGALRLRDLVDEESNDFSGASFSEEVKTFHLTNYEVLDQMQVPNDYWGGIIEYP